jgi:cardiolipin synthase C
MNLISLRAAVCLCLLALVAGCALSPQQRDQVDARVAAERDQLAWRLPADSPVENGLDAFEAESGRHRLVVVDQGSDALALRLHLIRAAREEILFQNYIFHDDESGLLLLGELLAAANRGVRVRLLVDGLFSLSDPGLLARLEMAPAGFDVRLYSPLFHRAVIDHGRFIAAIACCFRTLNHRMHNKLVVIDGRHGLVGGRNTADRYFDLDTRMNFVDLEVLVSGPVVADMAAGFERFWDHERSLPPRHTRDVAAAIEQARWWPDWPRPDGRLAFAETLAEDPAWLAALLAGRGFLVDSVSYFTDPPDKPWQASALAAGDSTARIHALVASAEQQVLLQTPYFVMSPAFEAVLKQVGQRAEITVSSNSLAATDAFPVYAFSRRQRERAVGRIGVRLFEAKPFPAARYQLISRYPELIAEKAQGVRSSMRGDPAPATIDMPGPRISLHAKVLVVDGHTSLITSHNFDPRSEIYNSENGIVVRDRAFAQAMIDYVRPMTEPANAWRVAEKPRVRGPLAALGRGLARTSRRMPTLDLWPAYLTENYQLPSGAEGVEPDHPDFHDTWVSVGLAPEVVLGQRRVMTSLISRMFGFMWRIM